MLLTRKQREAVHKVYSRNPDGPESYREFRRKVVQGYDCVMLPWRGMWLGIETDGYTHS